MSVNTGVTNQAYAIINELQSQAKGGKVVSAVDTASFISAGQNMLSLGYDEVLGCISKLIQKTIFSVRPYEEKFKSIEMNNDAFGFATRKLSVADSSFEAGNFDLPVDGQSVDHYAIKRANILEQVFVGSNNFQYQSPTQFKNQIDNAFRNPEELVRFWAMILQNTYDQMTQAKENLKRGLLSNLVGAKIYSNANGIEAGTHIKLVTAFNEYVGNEGGDIVTLTDIRKDPALNKQFWEFVYAKVRTTSKLMEERTTEYHTNVTGKTISRHTPKANQRLYMIAPEVYNMDATVLADTFNKDLIQFADFEEVAFWQGIKNPTAVKIAPVVLQLDGTLKECDVETETQEDDNVFAILMDSEAMGTTTLFEYAAFTPLNAKALYTNLFLNANMKYFTDFTENAVIFTLD